MNNLLISEVFIDKTQNVRFGDDSPYETFTDDLGVLYRHLVKEHGRCTGKMYIEYTDGKPTIHAGWVFVKRCKYGDCDKTYLQETWVTVHEKKPKITVKRFLVDIDKVRKGN